MHEPGRWTIKTADNWPNTTTVVIYDTVVVLDTIYVNDSFQSAVWKDRTPDSKLTQFFFDNNTATFFKSDIIRSKTENNMIALKKVTLLSIVFLAFQHSILAQTNAGLSVGAVIWNVRDNQDHINSPVSPAFRVGGFSETILYSRISLGLGLTYSNLQSAKSYEVTSYAFPHGRPHRPASDLDLEAKALNDYFSLTHHQLSIPVKIVGTFNKFKPFAGFEYTFTSHAVKQLNADQQLHRMNFSRVDIGILGGICYRVGRVEFETEYYRTVTTQRAVMHSYFDYSYGFQRLSLGLRYCIKR